MIPPMRTTLTNLQGLRGWACLLVFFTHLANWETVFGISRPLLWWLPYFGLCSVDVFFVLSGFVIAHTQDKLRGQPKQLGEFVFRRGWRLYSPYWLMLGVAIVLMVSRNGIGTATAGSGWQWIGWLTLLPTTTTHTFLPPAWTLMYELAFYVVFAVLVLVPKRVGTAVLWAWAGAVAWATITGNAEIGGAWSLAFLSPHAWELLLGCAVAWLVRTGRVPRGSWCLLAGLVWAVSWWAGLGCYRAPHGLGDAPFLRVLTYGPMAALFVLGFVALERRGVTPFPTWLKEIGEGSYSIYLLHAPIGMAIFDTTLRWWPHDNLRHFAWLLTMTTACVGGGYLFHRWVERPLVKFGQRRDAFWRAGSFSDRSVVELRSLTFPARQSHDHADARSATSPGTAGSVSTNRVGPSVTRS
jgi:exopolysaccharide production protein ExoZ